MSSGKLTRRTALAPAPDVGTLAHACAEYLTHKKVRLADSSYRGYSETLKRLTEHYPNLMFAELAPPNGTALLEDFLIAHWGQRAGRTYNKHLSVLRDFCNWHVVRLHLASNPTLAIENAREAEVPHDDFSKDQRARILAANPGTREQIALRLFLDYALRKGSVLSVRLESFDTATRKVHFWMKGDRFHTVTIPERDPIWRHLAVLTATEPGHHYLLPRRVQRRRTKPQGKQMRQLEQRLASAASAAENVTDSFCAHEIRMVDASLANAIEWLRVATDSASYQVVQVFPGEPMGVHAMHDLWYHWLQRAGIVEAGVTRGKRIHLARHTAGQRVLDATGNLLSVQQLLGHQRISTTEGYIRADEDRVRADLERTVPDERLDEALLTAASASLHVGSRA